MVCKKKKIILQNQTFNETLADKRVLTQWTWVQSANDLLTATIEDNGRARSTTWGRNTCWQWRDAEEREHHVSSSFLLRSMHLLVQVLFVGKIMIMIFSCDDEMWFQPQLARLTQSLTRSLIPWRGQPRLHLNSASMCVPRSAPLIIHSIP